MPSKRRRSKKTLSKTDSAQSRSSSQRVKKSTRASANRLSKKAETFATDSDQADLQDWLAEAEGLLWGTNDLIDPDAEIEQARATLARSPNDVNAYLILAGHAGSDRMALPLIEKAVAAGERAVGPKRFQKLVGNFWFEKKTRLYMNARLSLARCLWGLSRRDEALSHFQELLRLNPNDNQAVRYLLLNALISLGRFDDARALVAQYDESSATWEYSKVLIAFHDQGDTAPTHAALKVARRINKHVVPFLLGDKQLPDDQTAFYQPGDKYEAGFYLEEGAAAWKQVPGALTWLRAATSASSRGRKARKSLPKTMPDELSLPPATGPTESSKQRLKKLPLGYGTIWQVMIAEFRLPDEPNTEGLSAWMILALNLQTGFVIVNEAFELRPTPELLWDRLIDAMENPQDGSPGRPAEIQTRLDVTWQTLEPHLQEIEVDVINRPQLDELDQLIGHLNRNFGSLSNRQGLTDNGELPPEEIGHLYAAAAEFYRRQPWHFAPKDAPLRVTGTAVGDRPRYCLVMGQSAMTFGLSIYQSLDQVRSMFDGCCGGCDDGECDEDLGDEPACGSCGTETCGRSEGDLSLLTSSLAMLFDTIEGVTPADQAAIQQHGWPVAGPEAFPTVYRTADQLTPEQPTAADLRLLAACLIAIPGFASRHPFDQGGNDVEEFSFTDGGRPMSLTLSWVRDDDEAEI